MNKKEILTAEESALVADLVETYGIEPEEIMFFEPDKKPFLSYEATCVLSNKLLNLQGIDIEPVPGVYNDSLSLKCTFVFDDGRIRSAVGVVNFNENMDGEKLSEQQLYALASSRAIRNTLRTASVDLIKLHQAQQNEVYDFRPKVKSNFASLLGQAHQLGTEAGVIVGKDKSMWYLLLQNRYGVRQSNQLDEEQLADFVALLKSIVPQPQKKAA